MLEQPDQVACAVSSARKMLAGSHLKIREYFFLTVSRSSLPYGPMSVILLVQIWAPCVRLIGPEVGVRIQPASPWLIPPPSGPDPVLLSPTLSHLGQPLQAGSGTRRPVHIVVLAGPAHKLMQGPAVAQCQVWIALFISHWQHTNKNMTCLWHRTTDYPDSIVF